jgi:SAM-dependent methyltransferase
MKLSELVELRNQIDSTFVEHARFLANAELNKLMYSAQSSDNTELISQLQTDYQEIQSKFEQFETTINSIQHHVVQQINEQGAYWFQESYRLYDEEMTKFETTDYILNRQLALPQEAIDVIKSRLRIYAEWKYPGMIIRPGKEDFIQELVSYDPLYLVDQSYELLSPALSGFNELYQNRLRSYAIKESLSVPILDKIPNNQFGVIFAYNFFEFKPFDIFKQYLIEIYQKLRPGGVLIMTFNDCDQRRAVEAVEHHFCCYTPGHLVLNLAKSIGYTEVFRWSNTTESSICVELKKAGELTSLRGGQTLAKIMIKSVDNP